MAEKQKKGRAVKACPVGHFVLRGMALDWPFICLAGRPGATLVDLDRVLLARIQAGFN